MDHEKVILTDVTGRDGFQMEKEWIETEDKISILNGIIASGVRRIEATSFVSPKAVPQLSDAKEVIRRLNREHVDVIALIPNEKGAERAIDAGVDEVNVVVSASETHNKKNINKTVAESIEEIGEIFELMEDHGKQVNVGLATTFGCPFEGLYTVERVKAVIKQIASHGLTRFMLADTTGMANPVQVSGFIKQLRTDFPGLDFSLHLHNTRGMGLANIVAGYEAGIRKFDGALGGIGGCPFAPGATGNVSLEDVVHMFQMMQVPVDPEVNRLIMTSRSMEKLLGYKLPGQVMNAGLATETVEP